MSADRPLGLLAEYPLPLARLIEKKVGPDGGIVITSHFNSDPAFRYFIVARYADDWENPPALLPEPVDPKLNKQLESPPHIWIIGYGGADIRLLPGWKMAEFHSVKPGFCVEEIERT